MRARPESAWRWYTWGGSVLAATALVLLRAGSNAQRFTIGSEDGSIFAREPRAIGVWGSFHTTYAGYFLLLLRIPGAVASALPLRWTPFVFVPAAALVGGAAAVIAARCARGGGLSVPGAVLVGAAVVVLPAAGWEVPLELTNIEWYIIAAYVVFVAAWLAGYRPPVVMTTVLLVAAGLTSPLLVVALPFLLVRTWQRRERLDLAVTAAVVATAAVQFLADLLSTQTSRPGTWTVFEVVREYAARVVVGGFAGARFVPALFTRLGTPGTLVAAAVVIVLLGASAWSTMPAERLTTAFLLYASVAYLGVAMLLRPVDFHPAPIGVITVDGITELWDGRYMAAPGIALVLLAVMAGDRLFAKGRAGQAVAAVLGVLCVAMLVANFRVDVHHDTLAHWDAQVTAAQTACTARHGAGTMSIVYGPFTEHPSWQLVLSCKQAFP